MSVWSGIAATGVAIALAVAVIGQPIWEWRMDSTQEVEVWSYGLLSARHTVYNKTQSQMTTSLTYTYAQLAPLQPRMAAAMGDLELFFLLGLVAAFAGAVVSAVSVWKKLRGIFAGAVLLASCAALLYSAFGIVFSIPSAASDLPSIGPAISEFKGGYQIPGSSTLTWGPLIGWVLAIGAGLAAAWASSDLWHIMPMKKAAVRKPVPAPSRLVPVAPPPPPTRADVPVDVHPEPVIEEVFVIGSNGLLIKHMSRTLMTDKDRDVVGSMISAISSFVREAFSERDGEVHEVALGEHRFVMCNESGLVLAVLVTSGDTEDIVHRLRHLLAILQERYADRLSGWHGEALDGIEDELSVLWEPYFLPPPPAA